MAEDRMLSDEILLGLIKKNGGSGGTTDYNNLSNKPQIAGTKLEGNKSLADLGIASASDLAAKQNALTAGDYVVIKNDKISVSKLKQGELDLYSYEFVTTDTSHTPKVKVVKKVNGETISETIYDEFQAANWMTFDDIIRFRYDAGDSYKWKYQCLVTSNEHVKDTVVSWYWNQAVDYTETFDVGSSAITDLVTKGDMNDALATKQDTLTFDDTPTDGSNNPVKSNGIYDALATKANTDMVAADFNAETSYTAGRYCVQDGKLYKFKNNHSGAWSSADVDEVKITGELSALKSGLIGKTDFRVVHIPDDLSTINDAINYLMDHINTVGSGVYVGAWTNHDYYMCVAYTFTDNVLAVVTYGTNNSKIYNVSWSRGAYNRVNEVMYTT